MNEQSILEHVHSLVEEERALRHAVSGAEAAERLARLEQELDQCWDLLRQRRAKREFGADPEQARPRDTGTVEGYIG